MGFLLSNVIRKREERVGWIGAFRIGALSIQPAELDLEGKMV
jgi:hypothetical protein